MELKIEEIYQEELYVASVFFTRGYDMQEIKYLLEGSTVIEVLANKIHRNFLEFNRAMKNTDKKIISNEKNIARILNEKLEKDINACIIKKLEFAIEVLQADERKTPRRKEIIKQLSDDKKECQKIIEEGEEKIILPNKKGCIYKILEYNYKKSIKNFLP